MPVSNIEDRIDLLTNIINNTEDGIAYYSAVRNSNGEITDFRFEFLNESSRKYLYESTERLIGKMFLDIFPGNRSNGLFDAFCRVCETGKSIEDTFRYEEGKYQGWFKNIIVKYEDGIITFFRDVTERKKLQLEVKKKTTELEEMNSHLQRLVKDRDTLFSNILNKALDGVLYLIPIWENESIIDFKTVYLNESGSRTLKLTEEEFYSKTFLENFPNARENNTFQMYSHLFLSGEFKKVLVPYEDKRIYGWYSIDAFKYEDGVIIYFRDETLTVQHQKQIEEQNDELKSLVKQKEILLQETHHRVKNNLQVIASLLSLQSNTIKDPEALEAFRISMQRIKTMAVIHEKLYRDKNFKKMDFQGFISDVITSVRGFYDSSKVVKFRYNIEDIDLQISTCINVGLLLNELFSNSVKHAFREQESGEISVTSKLKGDNLTLVVSDNGKGFPDGFNINKVESLGLTIVRMLVDQLSGTFSFRNDNGAVFEITFPINS